ncbi:MAG TPA: glycosyltransferase family 2 protein [Blastocatellia bacterium]|nr:glycosyltransferase family 2 protein [Blastocatellia bacterium]
MIPMIFAILLLVLSASILLVVLWNVAAWPGFREAGRGEPRAVSVLIPARDEESNLPGCLDSALAQGEVVAEVLVYDDHSTDGTAGVVRRYAARDRRVRLIEASSLPQGWCGKTYACARLAEEAGSEWMIFLDADARLEEWAAGRMLGEARRRNVTLLSAWPALRLESFWEKALMPLLNYVVFTLFPAPLSLARWDASLGLAHGACILVERASYFAVGGHAAVRDQVFEDQRLAQAWRARGERGLCLDGRGVVSVRMYRSFGEIWGGFQKNFFPAFRRESSFWLFLLAHAAVFLGPFLLLACTRAWPAWLAAACVLAQRALLALRFKHPLWSVLLHPVAEVILIALGLTSWRRCRSGRGVEWKGRRYHANSSS